MTVLWAANFIVAKYALRDFPPLLASGLRTIIAAIILLPIYIARAKRNKPEWSRRLIWKLIILGLLGVGLNQVLFVFGMARTSVAHAALIIGLTPVTVFMLAAAAGQERLSPARLVGMFIALAGVAVLQLSGGPAGDATFLGDLIVFTGSSAFAAFTVVGKSEAKRVGGITVNTFAYVTSALALLPPTLWQSRTFDYAAVTVAGWVSLAYMAVVASVVCYMIYYWALAHMPASKLSAFSYLQPLLATLMAIPMLGEYPTKSLILGGALILGGVFVTERL